MDTSVLEDIGLSKNEISVFVKLLELGESKAGDIITKTGLQSSAVYNAINVLIEKGLVSYIKKSQVKYYKAAEPETILDYIEKKKSEYLRLLPELKNRQTKNEEESVEFYRSFKGMKTIISELEKDAKKGDILRFFSIEDPEEYKIAMDKVFKAEKAGRKEKKLTSKGIYHEKTRYMIKASSISKHRFVNFPMPPNTQILGDKVVIISWKGDEPSGILIKSKNIAKSYVDFFEHIWEKARE